eukprot:scaffold408_cov71-Cylindrotheca_fusiformis.AAC.4
MVDIYAKKEHNKRVPPLFFIVEVSCGTFPIRRRSNRLRVGWRIRFNVTESLAIARIDNKPGHLLANSKMSGISVAAAPVLILGMECAYRNCAKSIQSSSATNH